MGSLPDFTQISDALGWAVLHSLWQGALAAVLVWGFRQLTRESAADTRYMLGFVTLCTLLAAFIGTFLYYYSLGGAAQISGQLRDIITLPRPLTGNTGTQIGNPLMRVTDYTALVGAIWAACFVLLGVRYLSAFRLTHKLRTSGISGLPSNWQGRFNQLAKRSAVTGKVRGFISEHVSSPITFGFWKPIILVPAWFFTGLTPEQCEAVLLHEFAHIRRHDYLTNIVQILVKTVLFYHPAVGYISKMIDADREHACDDFAVLVTNSPEMLAKALGTIRIKAARDGGVFALSADGPEAPLMHRLKRLMGAPIKKTYSGSSRGYAATLMIAITGVMALSLSATNSMAHPHKPDADTLAGATISSPEVWPTPKIWDKFVDDTITMNGEVYKSTAFSVTNDGGEYYVINGKKYPSKYMYSVYEKGGVSHVVKQKNGKKYIEIGSNWYRVDTENNISFPVTPTPPVAPKYSYTYAYKDGQKYKIKTKTKTGKTYINIDGKWQKASTSGGRDHGHRHVKIDGKLVNIENIDGHVNIAPPIPPVSPNYWISDEDRQRVEDAVERATEQRERATEQREQTTERREAALEAALERAAEQRERVAERRERAQERKQHAREQAQRKRESKQVINYEDMRDALIPLLKADGYLSGKNASVVMDMTEKDIFINGQLLPGAQEGKYCKIVSQYGMRKDDTKKITIKPDFFRIQSMGDSGTTQITIGEFNH